MGRRDPLAANLPGILPGIWKEGLAGNMGHALMKAASVDKLTVDDISKLRQTVAQWRATLKIYRDALKTLDDGPLNPSNT